MGKDKKHKNKDFIEEQEKEEQAEVEVEEIENEDGTINEEKLQEELSPTEESYKDKYIKLQADFENFKARTNREKDDMIFFLKQDILLKVLPMLDDIERIVANTKEEEKKTSIYEALVVLQKKLVGDLEKMGVKAFCSKGKEIDPNKHEVMTTIPGKKEGIICDEFEKGYELDGRVLRHAKVVAGAGE